MPLSLLIDSSDVVVFNFAGDGREVLTSREASGFVGMEEDIVSVWKSKEEL